MKLDSTDKNRVYCAVQSVEHEYHSSISTRCAMMFKGNTHTHLSLSSRIAL